MYSQEEHVTCFSAQARRNSPKSRSHTPLGWDIGSEFSHVVMQVMNECISCVWIALFALVLAFELLNLNSFGNAKNTKLKSVKKLCELKEVEKTTGN